MRPIKERENSHGCLSLIASCKNMLRYGSLFNINHSCLNEMSLEEEQENDYQRKTAGKALELSLLSSGLPIIIYHHVISCCFELMLKNLLHLQDKK